MKSSPTITILGEFTPSKTHDRYVEIMIQIGKHSIMTALPKVIECQGLELSNDEFNTLLEETCIRLTSQDNDQWRRNSDSYWQIKKKGQTYDVLKALYSGLWECRVCGPAAKVNPQPAARIGSLKTMGYVIASKTKPCQACNKKTTHDILIMLERKENRFDHGNELRMPISDKLKRRIKSSLKHIEVCFDVTRPEAELLVDHKYPSQRWNSQESENPDTMDYDDIHRKFQLLSNRSNMQKSRQCDACVKDGKRGVFFGIRWYFKGSERWEGPPKGNEDGCLGCPWHDLAEWKKQLLNQLNLPSTDKTSRRRSAKA
jgi:hypothetical protein